MKKENKAHKRLIFALWLRACPWRINAVNQQLFTVHGASRNP